MEALFELFLKEKTFLLNASPHTIRSYRQALDRFTRHAGGLQKQSLTPFVVGMREFGLSPVACNVYIRSVNSFLSWCFENGHTAEQLKIKPLKCEQKVIKTFSDAHIKAIVRYKPRTAGRRRIHALCCLLIDTGVRIEEGLSAKVSGVDFSQLLLTVSGKGGKERTVPISTELRKVQPWAWPGPGALAGGEGRQCRRLRGGARAGQCH